MLLSLILIVRLELIADIGIIFFIQCKGSIFEIEPDWLILFLKYFSSLTVFDIDVLSKRDLKLPFVEFEDEDEAHSLLSLFAFIRYLSKSGLLDLYLYLND